MRTLPFLRLTFCDKCCLVGKKFFSVRLHSLLFLIYLRAEAIILQKGGRAVFQIKMAAIKNILEESTATMKKIYANSLKVVKLKFIFLKPVSII